MTNRNKVLLKLSVSSDFYIQVLDEVMELGESDFLSDLKNDINKVIQSIEIINNKAYESNKDNVTIQTISSKFNYILNKEIK